LSGSDASVVCKTNARAALNAGRKDLARTWELAAVITNPQLIRQSTLPLIPLLVSC
jgi:hypothetical protein